MLVSIPDISQNFFLFIYAHLFHPMPADNQILPHLHPSFAISFDICSMTLSFFDAEYVRCKISFEKGS